MDDNNFIEELQRAGHQRVMNVIEEARAGAFDSRVDPAQITYDRVLSAFEIGDFVEDYGKLRGLNAGQVLKKFKPVQRGCVGYVALGTLSLATLPLKVAYYGVRSCGRGLVGMYLLLRGTPKYGLLIDELVENMPAPQLPQSVLEELLDVPPQQNERILDDMPAAKR
ncbi:hypothetical protein HY490_02105 [Candidatus Woesearchaeota archaeon]|nr:hypothetical protein [Candidatus Woesearchaeota archaeon]